MEGRGTVVVREDGRASYRSGSVCTCHADRDSGSFANVIERDEPLCKRKIFERGGVSWHVLLIPGQFWNALIESGTSLDAV